MEELTAPAPAALVRGEVRGVGGEPVEGARVSITSAPVPVPEVVTLTDVRGRFELAAPSAGEYAFTARAPAGSVTARVEIPAAPSSAPLPPAASADADVGNDSTAGAAPRAPAAEVRLVLTLPTGSAR